MWSEDPRNLLRVEHEVMTIFILQRYLSLFVWMVQSNGEFVCWFLSLNQSNAIELSKLLLNYSSPPCAHGTYR